MAEYKEKGINKDPNEVYLEVVGGRKKGLIPGLGSSGDLWYQRKTTHANNSSTSYTPSLLSQLSSKVQQSQQELNERMVELERQQAECEKKSEELERESVLSWRSNALDLIRRTKRKGRNFLSTLKS